MLIDFQGCNKTIVDNNGFDHSLTFKNVCARCCYILSLVILSR